MAEKLTKQQLHRIKNELIMAEKVNEDRLLPQMIEALRRYTGKHIPTIAYDWDIVLNEIYTIVQNELPAIFFRNPRAFLRPRHKHFLKKTTDPMTGKKVEEFADSSKSAKTQEAILNYTVEEIGYKKQARKLLLDALIFKHGILWHGYKGKFGMTEEQSLFVKSEQVFVQRICPTNFLFDPCVSMSNLDEGRWVARSFEVPLEDIVDDDLLHVQDTLKGKLGFANKIGTEENKPTIHGEDRIMLGGKDSTLLDYTDPDFKKSKYAKFVKVYEVFLRPTKKEEREGSNGHVLLITTEQDEPLRQNPWPYKAEGWPAKPLMFNEIPDQIFGMSDVEVYGEIADQKNMIVNLQLRDAQENSKVWVFFDKSGLDEEQITNIQNGNQTVVGVDGSVAGKVVVASPGGAASAPLYTLDGRIQGNLDEKSGINDIRKGTMRSGEESKFSVQQRMAGTTSRINYRQDIMADFLKDSFHYINQLNKQFMPIDEAVRITGSLDIEWSEKPTKEDIQADVDVDIDAVSMTPENPEKEIQENMLILKMITEAINNPPMMQKIEQEGNIFNVSPIIENLLLRMRVRDPEVFRKIKPEESQGFVSVAEIRAAKDNVNASLSGQMPSSPPAPGQDHRARLEMYGEVAGILQAAGMTETPAFQSLIQLIQMQEALMQEEMEKESPQVGQKTSFDNMGASSKFPAPSMGLGV